MLRQAVLGQSLNDIFIPPALYKKHNEERGDVAQLRQGAHGWLLRICALIQSLTTHYQPESQPTVVRALDALKPTVSWISLEAIVEANCIECIADALSCGDETILIVSSLIYASNIIQANLVRLLSNSSLQSLDDLTYLTLLNHGRISTVLPSRRTVLNC